MKSPLIFSQTKTGAPKIYVPVSEIENVLQQSSAKLANFVAQNCKPENAPQYDFDLFAEWILTFSRVIMRKDRISQPSVPYYSVKFPSYATCVDYGILPACNQSYKFYYAVLEEENFFLAKRRVKPAVWKRYEGRQVI